MKTLNEYLAELKPLMGTDDPKERERFEEILSILKEQFTSVDDKKIITDFWNKGMDELGKDIKELTLKVQLSEISKMVSLSYIAKSILINHKVGYHNVLTAILFIISQLSSLVKNWLHYSLH